MNIRQRFASDGSVTFYNAVGAARINHWRSTARHVTESETELIENLFEDEGSVHAPVPDEATRSMSLNLARCFRTFIPDSEAKEWHWVKTFAGTGDMPVRRKFESPDPTQDIMDVSAIPGCILVALDDDTCLYVYGWNHNIALRTDRRLVRLNKGDVLVYRGDLIFGPVGYETNNVCLHAYLDSPNSERLQHHHPLLVPTADDTTVIEDPFCLVWNCSFTGKGALAMRRHLNRYHGFRFQHLSSPKSCN